MRWWEGRQVDCCACDGLVGGSARERGTTRAASAVSFIESGLGPRRSATAPSNRACSFIYLRIQQAQAKNHNTIYATPESGVREGGSPSSSIIHLHSVLEWGGIWHRMSFLDARRADCVSMVRAGKTPGEKGMWEDRMRNSKPTHSLVRTHDQPITPVNSHKCLEYWSAVNPTGRPCLSNTLRTQVVAQ